MDLFDKKGSVSDMADYIKIPHKGDDITCYDNYDSSISHELAYGIFLRHPVKLHGASIIMCCQGEFRCRVNLREYKIRSGEMVISQNGSILETLSISDGGRMLSLSCNDRYIKDSCAPGDYMFMMQWYGSHPIVCPEQSVFNECMQIYWLVKNSLQTRIDMFLKMSLRGYVQALCSLLLCNCVLSRVDETHESPTNSATRIYNAFISQLEREFRHKRKVKEYADTLCVTTKYLSSIIKRASGRNAGDIIDDMIMLEAKALLKDGSHTVAKVAEALNFPNQSFFAKFFKSHEGISPSAYIQS